MAWYRRMATERLGMRVRIAAQPPVCSSAVLAHGAADARSRFSMFASASAQGSSSGPDGMLRRDPIETSPQDRLPSRQPAQQSHHRRHLYETEIVGDRHDAKT